ncbi:filamentous hemagglutinin N-terminal domain-containing protein [Calothrix sp. FACHB-1219]|uniref:two-partner secretion domain-containing protein n=1 Tax=unclassified Calothrix TaxID=2619626 RepID=UPI0016871130|nr:MULTISPECIES: filamentous hemagglutinin N-terminal domain-containing protein [unclassified Calothrix]MBD2204532.1 filamentous hemagglutinin N-terminal domain-containing protein [Calothrix sp. FACHB-168]MBD2219330.1 filamentous hemagglutinin N-terminal domain-containing protein [Calothrix sp. FACHB-1219]
MNQIQNWLQGNCVLVKRCRIKRSKCDRTSFHEGFWRILATISLQPKLILCSLIFFSSAPAYSQINPDNTLGAESSRITPNVLINGANADQIDGGAVRGSNLFHSFSDFNINNGQRVYFGNPAGVQNILTRVTGGQASNILGTLGVNGNANLFLINPNGILFGQNARLDIRGSFVATTANAVQLGNQGIFSATNPEAPPLLTVNPSALLFNQINPKPITNRSRFSETDTTNAALFSPEQGSRFLVGGNIIFDGGQIGVLNNRLELGGLAAVGSVELIGSGNEMQLSFPENVSKADITFQNNAAAVTTGGSPITFNAHNLSLSNNSLIGVGLAERQGTVGIASDDLTINATGTVSIDDKSYLVNFGSQNSLGDTGNIAINAKSIRLSNDSQIATDGERNRGDIRLNVLDDITLDSNSFINTFGNNDSIGKSGDITFNARTINLSNRASINSGNIGQGLGGKITLQAQDSVSLSGSSSIASSSAASAFGGVNNQPSGDIEIKARTLSLDGRNTTISSRNFDEGQAGNIQIITDDLISLNGFATITSSVTGQGNGGDIQLQTRVLTLSNGSNIDTLTRGQGKSGNLLINALDSVTLTGTTMLVDPRTGENLISGSRLGTNAQGSGNGGKLTINTGRLSIRDGGDITTNAFVGQSGRGGDLIINARESVEVVGTIPNGRASSAIRSSTFGSGDAGNMTITTPRLSVREGGSINTATEKSDSTGRGGNLTINASDLVEVVGVSPDGQVFSDIFAGTTGSGDAGNMTINTSHLSIRGGALVGTNTRVSSKGKGGNLTINALDTVEVVGTSPDSKIISRLTTSTGGTGNAGNLTINTRFLSIRDLGLVSATSSSTGNSGNLTVNASDSVDVIGASADGKSGTVLTTATSGTGNAGNLNINTRRLSILDGGFVSTSAAEKTTGQGGNLTINASDLVEIVGRSSDDLFGSFLTTGTSGSGNAGNLSITTHRLSLSNGGYINTTTGGAGRGGNIDINATNSVEILANPADIDLADGIFTSTGGAGNAGDVTIRTQSLSIQNGGVVSASTVPESTGQGGNVTINASDRVEVVGISNNGLLPSFISVRSRGEGKAGDITVNSPLIKVENRGAINAESFANDGGNITLNSNLLLLRRGGNVSATAGNQKAGGNGGNISINSSFIVAVPNENSDISADAFTGKGGNVDIKVQNIFGTEARSQQTSQSDITASSDLGVQGEITISSPEVQTPQKLLELPTGLIDASTQFAQTCPRGRYAKPLGSFVVTGRGGSLPPNTLEPLTGTTNLSPLATLDGEIVNSQTDAGIQVKEDAVNSAPIVEAQGLVKTADGNIILVAQAPTATPNATSSSAMCPAS